MGTKNEVVWNNLSVEIVEHILSLLSVRDLCRLRSVCKTWNEMMGKSTFHDLCDQNKRNNAYLFLLRKEHYLREGSERLFEVYCSNTSYLFDMDVEQWYSIPIFEPDNFSNSEEKYALDTRHLAMDNGLVCHLVYLEYRYHFSLSISDPIAKIRRNLPNPPLTCFDLGIDRDLHIVSIVDHVTRRFQVFFFNRQQTRIQQARIWVTSVYESFTNKWRKIDASNLQGFYDAICFQNTVFALASHADNASDYRPVQLLRYQHEGDLFEEVWCMRFPRSIRFLKLLVSNNRLFVLLVSKCDRTKSPYNCPNSESLFHTKEEEEETLFEMYEILIAERSRAPVVQFTTDELKNMFEGVSTGIELEESFEDPEDLEDVKDIAFTYGYPCFDSNGICSSVVMVHHHSGGLRRYHMATGAVDVLPSCPGPFSDPVEDDDGNEVFLTFETKAMNLSMRDLLSQRFSTTGWKILTQSDSE